MKTKQIRLTLIVLLSILVLIVVLQNTESVQTKILFATITMPRALLLFLTFAAGCVTGLVLALQLRQRSKQPKT